MLIDYPLIGRRLAAVTLLVFLLLGSYVFAINPYRELVDNYRAEIVSLGGKIARFNALIGQKDKFQRQLMAVKNNNASSQYFIKAKTVTLASALLQQRVKKVVQAKGGQLVSTQVSLPANSVKMNDKSSAIDNQLVAIKVSMKATIESLYEIFYMLEGGSPLVVIDDVSINRMRQGRRLNVANDQQQNLLEVRCTITAQMKNKL
ncbi:type II secretion system protein GspM [Kaarinaea lacus]